MSFTGARLYPRQGVVVLGLAVALSGPVHALSPSRETKPPIPSDLLYEAKPVTDEDNTIYLWRRAAKGQLKADDRIKEVIRYAWEPEAVAPSDEDQAAIQYWLEQNREALRLMEESIKKPASQWLAKNGEEGQPEIWALVTLTRARMVQAARLAEQDQYQEAANLLDGNLRLSQLAIESDAALIHYLVGARVRTTTQQAIMKLSSRRDAPVATLQRLLEALPSLNTDTNAYDHALRVEFTIYEYPGVDINWFAKAWSQSEAKDLVSLMYPEEFQRAFMVLTDPGLVALHPKPFDEIAGIARAAETYRRYRTNACSLWADRVEADEEAAEETNRQFLAEIEPMMKGVADEKFPLNPKAISKARARYLALSDPIGRILQCKNSLLSCDDSRVFKNRTEREAVRLMLALILFERQHGQLPVSVSELVDGKILPRVPWDFFANAPLKYSKERRVIWSFGEDAEDDDADGTLGAPWSGLDAVWEISERTQ